MSALADKARAASVRLARSDDAAFRRTLKPRAGPSPLLVLGAAFAAGVLLAKWIDWRGHAHRRG